VAGAPRAAATRFTGEVSDTPAPEPAEPAPAPAVGAGATPWLPARRPWSPLADLRTDLRAALVLVAGIAAAGLPAGLVWWWLAPRAEFHITDGGPVPVGTPSPELLVADDAILALVLAVLGLVAGIVGWRLRRRRGLAVLLAVALGTGAAGGVAWRFGVLLAPAPSKAEVADVGTTVTTGLSLGALPVLAVGPFAAVLAYLVPAAYAASDDLGRPAPPALPEATPVPEPAAVAPSGGSPRACEG
jgi:hypothetical protein